MVKSRAVTTPPAAAVLNGTRFDGMPLRLLKPHPFLIERGLTAGHALPADAVFIGDSITDIEAEIESYKFAREEERKAKAKSTVAVVTASRDDVSIVNFEIRNAGEISAELREKIKVETARFKKILEDMIKES